MVIGQRMFTPGSVSCRSHGTPPVPHQHHHHCRLKLLFSRQHQHPTPVHLPKWLPYPPTTSPASSSTTKLTMTPTRANTSPSSPSSPSPASASRISFSPPCISMRIRKPVRKAPIQRKPRRPILTAIQYVHTRPSPPTHSPAPPYHLHRPPTKPSLLTPPAPCLQLTLNDHPPSHPRFHPLLSELLTLQSHSIPVLALLGGAAPGTFSRLDGPPDQFERYYRPLAAFLRTYRLDGIDLDVEEPMSLAGIVRLIDRLRKDFGAGFLITLAPVAAALVDGGGNLSGFGYGGYVTRLNPFLFGGGRGWAPVVG